MSSNECQTSPVYHFGSVENRHLSNENSSAQETAKLTADPDFRPSSTSPCLLAQTATVFKIRTFSTHIPSLSHDGAAMIHASSTCTSPKWLWGHVTPMMSLIPSPCRQDVKRCDADQISAHNVILARAHFETHAPWPHSVIVGR